MLFVYRQRTHANIQSTEKAATVQFTGDEDWTGQTILLSAQKFPMPAIGFGTCCRPSAKGKYIFKSTLIYLKNGGRLIDTAMAYGNHEDIGRAVAESGIPREKLWITSKISVGRVKAKDTMAAIESILEELRIPYLDLLLIHTPKRGKEECVTMWKYMIEARDKGLTRAIGVSNFNKREILDLQEATGELPALNQIQFHPWTPREWKDQVSWQKSMGIQSTAYTSLGGSRFHSASEDVDYTSVLESIANKYGVTEPQVLLKWALQQDVAVIPGATSDRHIKENLNIPKNFQLTMDEMRKIEESKPPTGWFDKKRGPNKSLGEEAHDSRAWSGDHAIPKKM